MLNVKKRLLGGFVLLAASCCASGALAGTVIGTLNSVGSGDTITLHAVQPDGTPIGVQVLNGVSTFTRTGGTDATALVGPMPGSFFAFCVEPFEDAELNATYTYNVSSLANADTSSIVGGLGATRADRISELLGQYQPSLASPMSALQASALQVAIWEITSEASANAFNVFSGNTYFSTPGSSDASDVLNLAQTYLNYVSGADGSSPHDQGLEALTVNGNQDFLVQTVITAPEPGTWLMMLGGFGLVGWASRRRREREPLVQIA